MLSKIGVVLILLAIITKKVNAVFSFFLLKQSRNPGELFPQVNKVHSIGSVRINNLRYINTLPLTTTVLRTVRLKTVIRQYINSCCFVFKVCSPDLITVSYANVSHSTKIQPSKYQMSKAFY